MRSTLARAAFRKLAHATGQVAYACPAESHLCRHALSIPGNPWQSTQSRVEPVDCCWIRQAGAKPHEFRCRFHRSACSAYKLAHATTFTTHINGVVSVRRAVCNKVREFGSSRAEFKPRTVDKF